MEICFNMHEESSEYVSETKYEFKFGIQPCYSCFVRYANASLGWGTHMEEMRSSSTRESRTPICLPILVSLSLRVASKEKRSIKKASFDRIECLNLIAINLHTKYSIDSYLAVFFRI